MAQGGMSVSVFEISLPRKNAPKDGTSHFWWFRLNCQFAGLIFPSCRGSVPRCDCVLTGKVLAFGIDWRMGVEG